MNLAEIVAVSVAAWLALIEVTAYAMDSVGLTISPIPVLLVSLVITAFVTRTTWRDRSARPFDTNLRHDRSTRSFVVWGVVVCGVFGLLLRFAWPALLPPGKGPDLTHHLLLIDFIERNWHLVHDPALEGAMGEMAHYTPGAHLLAALFGAWSGTDGFRAVYPLAAACASLTAGFVFAITLRRAALPIALIGIALVLLPRGYFVDAFAHDSYFAQVVSALFAVAMWWATVVWDERPSAAMAALIAILATGTFLAWPVWIGPPLLAFFLAVLLRRDIPFSARARDVAIVVVLPMMVAVAHAIGRLGWARIVRASGAVLQPSLAEVGWVFPLLAITGLVLCIRDRRARVTGLFVVAIVLQTIALYLLAKSIGSQTPYMAFKMGYLAIYPLAVFGALALNRLKGPIGWIVAMALLVAVVRPLVAAPRPVPVVSRDFYEAGQWTRANVGSSCVDYLVEDADSAYWLHLAVLGNPRASQRTAEVDQHNVNQAIANWIPAEGRAYAIADLRILPDEIRNRVELVKEFGRAGVIRRPGRSCVVE